jgi:hypothetical protein
MTQQVPPKRRYVSTTVHGITFQKTVLLTKAKRDLGFTKSRVLAKFEASVTTVK